MKWQKVRQTYPHQWLVIEALVAHTEENRRKIDRMAVVDVCRDGTEALRCYQRLHRQYPRREFYCVHADRKTLDIEERRWVGIRRNNAVNA